VRPVHVAAWKEALKAEGRADSTVAQRLSALSSYYIYLQRPGPDGEPLHPHNPVQGVERDDLEVSPYERARKISVGAFRRILAQIDTDTPHGARDRALFLFYVLCGRRRREVLELRGRDIRVESKRTTYRVRLKGGRTRWKELPPPVWHAIQDYLAVSGRALEDDAPLFVAEVDNGDYLRRYYGKEAPAQMQAITGAAVSQALKRYARRAGLDPAAISLHSLRHLGAELYQQASGDIQQTQSFLDHSHLNTTQIYLSQLKGEEHRHWQAMANELKL
jgi:integrase/recombinase XerD